MQLMCTTFYSLQSLIARKRVFEVVHPCYIEQPSPEAAVPSKPDLAFSLL